MKEKKKNIIIKIAKCKEENYALFLQVLHEILSIN